MFEPGCNIKGIGCCELVKLCTWDVVKDVLPGHNIKGIGYRSPGEVCMYISGRTMVKGYCLGY